MRRTMTLRERMALTYTEYFNAKFSNNQGRRLSGQGYGADPSLKTLTYDEFIESFFGQKRLNSVAEDYINAGFGWTIEQEVDHAGDVLRDNVINLDTNMSSLDEWLDHQRTK